MRNRHLATYLNDHVAGAAGALEILKRLESTFKAQPLGTFCADMYGEVAADRATLLEVMQTLEISESVLRQAGAWIGEKFSRVKLRIGDNGKVELGLVLAFESLVLGIKGKEVLWRALGAIQSKWPQLERYDFRQLEERAIDQGTRVEERRLAAAREAFASALR